MSAKRHKRQRQAASPTMFTFRAVSATGVVQETTMTPGQMRAAFVAMSREVDKALAGEVISIVVSRAP